MLTYLPPAQGQMPQQAAEQISIRRRCTSILQTVCLLGLVASALAGINLHNTLRVCVLLLLLLAFSSVWWLVPMKVGGDGVPQAYEGQSPQPARSEFDLTYCA